MGAAKTKVHPVDYKKLYKGMWLETSDLESATFRKRTDPNFSFGVLKLSSLIEFNTGILSRYEQQRLRLMTDAEAVAWNIRQAVEASRKLERTAERLAEQIDRRNLSHTERAIHDHAQRVIGQMADAQRKAREKNARLFQFIARPALESGDDEE